MNIKDFSSSIPLIMDEKWFIDTPLTKQIILFDFIYMILVALNTLIPLFYSANCLSVGEELIFIGCADGIVRCFSPQTLQVYIDIFLLCGQCRPRIFPTEVLCDLLMK